MKHFSIRFYIVYLLLFSCSCNVTAQISRKTISDFLNDSAVKTGHAGISIYDPSSKKYLYNYNADKNFMPSSNVKLFTLYAGLKYLGDSILAAKVFERNDSTFFQPAGDPTFLHKNFTDQPFLRYLMSKKLPLFIVPFIKDSFAKYGRGWAWDDFQEDFMAERSRFPVYGNTITAEKKDDRLTTFPPDVFKEKFLKEPQILSGADSKKFKIYRAQDRNKFIFFSKADDKEFNFQQIPFITDDFLFNIQIRFLSDALETGPDSIIIADNKEWKNFYSRPADSLFRPMMFNSDNFFAEQTLLMISNEKLGFMSDDEIINTLLRNDFSNIPSKPRWADGSGLSRYNLFSPKDFIYILDKLKNEFGWQRIKNILPTGGEGTLKNYYENAAGHIYAKTGSMSNNVSLSGYLITKKNKTFLFSVIINNFSGTGTAGRRAIEKMLLQIRETN